MQRDNGGDLPYCTLWYVHYFIRVSAAVDARSTEDVVSEDPGHPGTRSSKSANDRLLRPPPALPCISRSALDGLRRGRLHPLMAERGLGCLGRACCRDARSVTRTVHCAQLPG